MAMMAVSSGIGAAIAEQFAGSGMRVTLMGRNRERLAEAATRLNAGSQRVDISDPDDVRRGFTAAVDTNGPVTVLVNNAGIAESGAFTKMSDELWERMLSVNLTGTYLCTKSVVDSMSKADWVTEKAVRWGNTWVFVSFNGNVYPVDVSGETPKPGETWSLLSEKERKDSWRPGGVQLLAVYLASAKLYSLMHQGGDDTHKEDPGQDVWVYDLEKQKQVQKIKLEKLATAIQVSKDDKSHWRRPVSRLYISRGLCDHTGRGIRPDLVCW